MTTEFPPLLTILEEMDDPRHAQGKRHPLSAVLGMMCVATLCGYRSYGAMAEWGRHYGSRFLRELGFTRDTPPCASTLHNLLRRLNVSALETALSRWVEAVLRTLSRSDQTEAAFAMDGKSLRGSKKQGARLFHLLAIVGHRLGLTLAQRVVTMDAKESENAAEAMDAHEISAAQTLLRGLLHEGRLKGRLFTMDALLTQRKIAGTIREGDGDYVMIAKANQPQLHDDIRLLFEHPDSPRDGMEQTHTWDAGHGRVEFRRLVVSSALKDSLDWPGAWQVFQLHRRTQVTRRGGMTMREETVYGVTSLSPKRADPSRLLSLIRSHWSIENRLHWVRDMTFDEDRSQVRTGNIPPVMAAIRNFAVGTMRAVGETNIASACRRFAAQPKQALRLIGSPSVEN